MQTFARTTNQYFLHSEKIVVLQFQEVSICHRLGLLSLSWLVTVKLFPWLVQSLLADWASLIRCKCLGCLLGSLLLLHMISWKLEWPVLRLAHFPTGRDAANKRGSFFCCYDWVGVGGCYEALGVKNRLTRAQSFFMYSPRWVQMHSTSGNSPMELVAMLDLSPNHQPIW